MCSRVGVGGIDQISAADSQSVRDTSRHPSAEPLSGAGRPTPGRGRKRGRGPNHHTHTETAHTDLHARNHYRAKKAKTEYSVRKRERQMGVWVWGVCKKKRATPRPTTHTHAATTCTTLTPCAASCPMPTRDWRRVCQSLGGTPHSVGCLSSHLMPGVPPRRVPHKERLNSIRAHCTVLFSSAGPYRINPSAFNYFPIHPMFPTSVSQKNFHALFPWRFLFDDYLIRLSRFDTLLSCQSIDSFYTLYCASVLVLDRTDRFQRPLSHQTEQLFFSHRCSILAAISNSTSPPSTRGWDCGQYIFRFPARKAWMGWGNLRYTASRSPPRAAFCLSCLTIFCWGRCEGKASLVKGVPDWQLLHCHWDEKREVGGDSFFASGLGSLPIVHVTRPAHQ